MNSRELDVIIAEKLGWTNIYQYRIGVKGAICPIYPIGEYIGTHPITGKIKKIPRFNVTEEGKEVISKYEQEKKEYLFNKLNQDKRNVYPLDFFKGKKITIEYIDCNKLIVIFANQKFIIHLLEGNTKKINDNQLLEMFLR